MSTVTLRDALDELERGLARSVPVLYADDEEDEDDLYGEDDLGFDDIDEEDDEDLDDDLDGDDLEEIDEDGDDEP